jgi:hypothetical protein
LRGREQFNSESLWSITEVALVERDDCVRTAVDRCFQHKFVAWIA